MSDELPPGSLLFVGNLSWDATDQSLREAFGAHDDSVIGARVATDRYSGLTRGFGFVSFRSAEAAKKAKERMNGAEVNGRPIRVDMAFSNQRN